MPFEESRSRSLERDQWLTIPNALTLLRLLAIIPFALLAMCGRDLAALTLFVLSGFTDTIDGAIARRFGQGSKIGRLLDPVADKLFTGVAFVVLAAFRNGLSRMPLWVMAAVVFRDFLILVGSAIVFNASRNTAFKPSVYGKLNTFIEIGVVVCFLSVSALPFIAQLLPALYILLLVSLLISVADYLRTGLRMMRQPVADGDFR